VKHVEPLVYVCLCRCVLAAPYLACLEVAEREVLLHSVSLTGTDVKTKSLSEFLGETNTDVTLETVGGSQPAVAVATVGSPKKHVLILKADGFVLYPQHLPKASELYITLNEKSGIIIQAQFVEGVSTEDSSKSNARRTGCGELGYSFMCTCNPLFLPNIVACKGKGHANAGTGES
jgi:hypothetical protein